MLRTGMTPSATVTDWYVIIRHPDLAARLEIRISLREIFLVIQDLTNMAVETNGEVMSRNLTKPRLTSDKLLSK
jgi:hypothetical protein